MNDRKSESSKGKQRFLKYALIVVLLGYQIWAAFDRPPAALLCGALMALAMCGVVIALAFRWDKPAYTDWSIAGYLAFIAGFLAMAPGAAKSFLHEYAVAAIFGSFLIAAFFPPLFGWPSFTLYAARKKVPAVLWNHPAFLRLNVILAYFWSGIFGVCVLLSLIESYFTQLLAPNLLILAFGLPFSSRFSVWYLKRRGITKRPESLSEFMAYLPLGFNPQAARDARGVIQFNFTGPVEGSCHFKIADGNILPVQGAAATPALTISTPFDLWIDILTGRADGRQALMAGRWWASGDMNLLMKMGELFNKNKKARAAA